MNSIIEYNQRFLLREFFLNDIKDIISNKVYINKGYIYSDIDGDLEIKRSVYSDNYIEYTLCAKGRYAPNKELEENIPEWLFNKMWPETYGKRIDKLRHDLCYGDQILHINEYLKRLHGLFIMECSFDSVKDMNRFVIPWWALCSVDLNNSDYYNETNLVRLFGY